MKIEEFIKKNPSLSNGEYRLVITDDRNDQLRGYLYPFGMKYRRLTFRVKGGRIISEGSFIKSLVAKIFGIESKDLTV